MALDEAQMTPIAEFMDSIKEPEDLAELLEGLSDKDIEDAVEALGVERALSRVFRLMVDHFLPEKAARYSGSIEWNIQTTQGRSAYHLKLEGGKCSHAAGAASYAKVRLTASLPVFLRLVSGRVSGLQEYADGRLQVGGDMVLALTQQTFFDVDLGNAELNVSTPSQLSRLLKGRSDEEIEAGVLVTGVDKALDKVFDGMVALFRPSEAGRKQAVIEWNISTPQGTRTYQFLVDNGRCSYRRGAGARPNISISVSLPVLLRVASGQLNGLVALAKGQLKVKGNILLARAIQSWFDLNR